jgi:hypothetical protein
MNFLELPVAISAPLFLESPEAAEVLAVYSRKDIKMIFENGIIQTAYLTRLIFCMDDNINMPARHNKALNRIPLESLIRMINVPETAYT